MAMMRYSYINFSFQNQTEVSICSIQRKKRLGSTSLDGVANEIVAEKVLENEW